MAASEIEEEFKKFGRIKPDGVAIRTRKVCSPSIWSFCIFASMNNSDNWNLFGISYQDIDICYAFVEFEDVSGVQNAIKVCSFIKEFELVFASCDTFTLNFTRDLDPFCNTKYLSLALIPVFPQNFQSDKPIYFYLPD